MQMIISFNGNWKALFGFCNIHLFFKLRNYYFICQKKRENFVRQIVWKNIWIFISPLCFLSVEEFWCYLEQNESEEKKFNNFKTNLWVKNKTLTKKLGGFSGCS